MKVVVDNDGSMGYERTSKAREYLDMFLLPILNSLPLWSKGLLRKTHSDAERVIDNVTTHAALEVVYSYGADGSRKNEVANFFQKLWQGTRNAKAVRNRLRLVKREIMGALRSLINDDKVHILSIASGSSRAIIESLQELEKGGHSTSSIDATFLDKSPRAIEYSKEMARISGLSNKFFWVENTAGKYLNDESVAKKFDIIEMVGLMDYLDDAKGIQILSSVKKALKQGGKFITANIADNPERKFLTNAVGWKMIYRTAEELASLLIRSGFSESGMRIYYEPLCTHSIIIVTND
jgi:SAM-dependent methyltransferase